MLSPSASEAPPAPTLAANRCRRYVAPQQRSRLDAVELGPSCPTAPRGCAALQLPGLLGPANRRPQRLRRAVDGAESQLGYSTVRSGLSAGLYQCARFEAMLGWAAMWQVPEATAPAEAQNSSQHLLTSYWMTRAIHASASSSSFMTGRFWGCSHTVLNSSMPIRSTTADTNA